MPKRSEKHMLMRRQQILDAATRVFVSKGIHQTSMRDICIESGLSTGAVYNHFASKQDLIIRHAEQAIAANPVLSFDSLAEFRQHVLSILQDHSPEARQMLSLEFQIFEESLRDDYIQSIVCRGLQNIVANYLQCLRDLSERGEINPAYDINVGARRLAALISSVLLFTHLKLEKEPGDFIDCVELEFTMMVKPQAESPT